jgi:hypothetical protein
MRVEYRSNNSGGSWWLKDEDWKALEAAGWKVIWGGLYFCPRDKDDLYSKVSWNQPPRYPFECVKTITEYDKVHKTDGSCLGHQRFLKFEDMTEADRYLGCFAKEARLECETPGDAMRSFEQATGKDVTDEGCNCCGCPHTFSWGSGDTYGSASGDDCIQYLHPGKKIPRNLREAVEDES